MHAEDEIHARVGAPCHSLGLDHGYAPRFPCEKTAVGIEGGFRNAQIHSAEARARDLLALPCGPGTIQDDARVMNGFRTTGTNLDSLHPSRCTERHRNDEVPKYLRTSGAQF